MKSGDWKKREDKVLRHIGLYRISLRVVMERLFFDGRTSGNLVSRLVREDRMQLRRDLPGGLSHYQLSIGEARRRAVPVGRARTFGARAMHTHLAVLWNVCVSHPGRRRLEDEETRGLLGGSLAAASHIAEAGESPCVYRVYVVGATTRVSDMIKRLRREIHAASANDTLEKWIRNGQYRILMLADIDERVGEIDRAVRKAKLNQLARFALERAPSQQTIAEEIDGLRCE